MPVINITTWPTSQAAKNELMSEITRVVHKVTGASLDKISVYIQEIAPSNWADAGVVGTDTDFASKSRRKKYESTED